MQLGMKLIKGVSMIVLVITIIVILIISTTVILMANRTNYNEISNEAVFKSNLNSYKTELVSYIANEVVNDSSLKNEDFNANGPIEVKAMIKSMTNRDSYNYIVENGKLVYIGEDEQEQAWVRDEGIEVATDRILPSASIIPDVPNPTNATKITYEIAINKSNNGLSSDKINLNFGTKGKFQGSQKIYTLEVTDLEEGVQKITIPENSFTDKAGTPNKEIVYEMIIDYTSPMLNSLEVTEPSSGSYATGKTITFVANYSEKIYNSSKVAICDDLLSAPVLNIRIADFDEEGVVRQIPAVSATDETITYEYTITAEDIGDVYLESYTGSVYDLAGNVKNIENVALTGSTITANIFHSATTIQSIDVSNVGTKGSNTHNGYFEAKITLSGSAYSDRKATVLMTPETSPNLKLKFGDGNERLVSGSASSVGTNSVSFTKQFIPVNGENGKLIITGLEGAIFGSDRRPIDLSIIEAVFDNCIAHTEAPNIMSLEVTNPTTAGTYYNRYQTITFVATYDENLYNSSYTLLENALSEAPTLQIKFGSGATRTVNPTSSSENKITYVYTVDSNDLGTLSIVSYSGNVYDEYGNVRNISTRILTGPQIDIAEYYSSTKISNITMTSTGTKNSSSLESFVASVTYSGSLYSDTQGTLITQSTSPRLVVKFGSGSDRTIDTNATSVNSSGSNFTQSFLPTSSENGYLYVTGISGTVYGADKRPINPTITQQTFTSCIADNAGPTLSSFSITSPTSGTYSSGTVVQITAKFSDSSLYNSSGAAITTSTAPTAQIKFGSGSYKTMSCYSVSGNTIVYRYTTVSDDSGYAAAKISGSLYDALGNLGTISSTSVSGYSIRAYTTPPLSVSLTASQSNGTITVKATPSGGTGTVKKYVFSVDGSQVQSGSASTYSFTPSGTLYSFNTYAVYTAKSTVTANNSNMSSPGYGYYFTVTITDSTGATASKSTNYVSASNSTIGFAINASGGPAVYATQLPFGNNWVLQYSTNGTSFTTTANSSNLSVKSGTTIYARFYNAYSGSTSGNKTYTFYHTHKSECYGGTCPGTMLYYSSDPYSVGYYYCSTCGRTFTSYSYSHYRSATATCGY